MSKVLFIAYHFPPVGGAGVQRALKFVQNLPAEGFLPIVVAGPGETTDFWSPRDASLLAAIPAEVSVHRVKGPVPRSSGKLKRRMETLLGMPTPFSSWWTRTATDMALRNAEDAALIFATMSPFESADVARTVSRTLRVPWVADLRDPWAIDEVRIYPSYLHRKLDAVRMEGALSTAALIVMNTPAAAEALKQSFPRLGGKPIITIPNGYDAEDFGSHLPPREDSKFRIVHSGTTLTSLGLKMSGRSLYRLLGGARSDVSLITRSPIFLVQAIERWCEREPGVIENLEVTFAGNIPEEDKALFRKSKFAGLFRTLGYLSHEESLRLVRTADLLFLPMHNLRAGGKSLSAPGKTYECMASGRPILAAVPDGDARDFLEKSGTAFLCRPDDIEEMSQILERVYKAWQEKRSITNYNADFVAQFDRRIQTGSLANGFRSVLAGARPAISNPVRRSAAIPVRRQPAGTIAED